MNNTPSTMQPQRYDSLSAALAVHVRLAQFFERDHEADDILDAFADSFARSVARAHSDDPVAKLNEVRYLAQQRAYRKLVDRVVEEAIHTGVTYWPSSAVMDEVAEAAALLEPEPIFPEDVPTPTGFLVLPRALQWWDDESAAPIVRAVAWMDTEATDPPIEMTGRDGVPGRGIVMWLFSDGAESAVRLWDDPDRPMPATAPVRRMGLWPVDLHQWLYGRPWREVATLDDSRDDPTQVALPHATAFRRWLLTLFRFARDELIVPEEWRPSRAEGRRAMRVLPIPLDGYIKVLHLRRIEYVRHRHADDPDFTADEDAGRKLAYRHRRRAHWRRIHKGTPYERRTWVRATIVGDESLPFVDSFDVTGITR